MAPNLQFADLNFGDFIGIVNVFKARVEGFGWRRVIVSPLDRMICSFETTKTTTSKRYVIEFNLVIAYHIA